MSLDFEGWIRGSFFVWRQVGCLELRYRTQIEGFEGYGHGVITVIDITDRTSPQIMKKYNIEDIPLDARLIDGDLYTIMNHYTSFPSEFWDDL